MKWLTLLLLVGCNASTPDILTPPSTTGCRLNEQECSDHACCPLDNFVCGGDDPHCFPNYCCPIGGPLGPTAQWGDGGTPPAGVRLKRRP